MQISDNEIHGALRPQSLTLYRVGRSNAWEMPRPAAPSTEFARICAYYDIPLRPPGCFTPPSGEIPVMYCATNPLDAYIQGFCCLSPSAKTRALTPALVGLLCSEMLATYEIGWTTADALVLDYSDFAAQVGLDGLPSQDLGGTIMEALHRREDLTMVQFTSPHGVEHSTLGVARPELLPSGGSVPIQEDDTDLLEALGQMSVELAAC